MNPKDNLDAFGVASLVAFALLLAFNQVVIKVSVGGFQPVFLAALRSLGAIVCVLILFRVRGVRLNFAPGTIGVGILAGLIFSFEFVCLFTALDYTSVSRASVIFYSMPFWAAVGAHFFLGEQITRPKLLGLIVAFGGVAWAIFDPTDRGAGRMIGDFAALGASLGWAAIVIVAKGTRLKELSAEMQMFWQVVVSGPVLLFVAVFFFGDLMRDVEPLHWLGLVFQIGVVAFGFSFWFWLLKMYPAGQVASFSFLSPIFSVALGWLVLGESIGPSLIGSLVLVVFGLVMFNRRQVPQKV